MAPARLRLEGMRVLGGGGNTFQSSGDFAAYRGKMNDHCRERRTWASEMRENFDGPGTAPDPTKFYIFANVCNAAQNLLGI